MRVSLALLLVWTSSLASGSRLPLKMDDILVDGGFGDDMITDSEDGPQEMNDAENDTIEVEESDMTSGEDNGPMEVQSVLQLYNITDRASGCQPRVNEGACPWLPNKGREACLTAVDNRPAFQGQQCVWCTKDCENKHQREVKSHANPSTNYEDCLTDETECQPRVNEGACPWLPN